MRCLAGRSIMSPTATWIYVLFGSIVGLAARHTAATSSTIDKSPVYKTSLQASHISLNAIRLSWTPLMLNATDDVKYHLAVSTTRCSEPELNETSTVTDFTFWKVRPRVPYLACVQPWVGDKPGNWTFVSVGVEAAEPPMIVNFQVIRHHPVEPGESATTYYFFPNEEVRLKCHARGTPTPNITWYLDGELMVRGLQTDIPTSESDLITSELVVADSDHDSPEGIYTCVAMNKHGKALSERMLLLEAVLETFPVNEQDREYAVAVGDSLQINCRSPFSRPKASFTWHKIRTRTDRDPVLVEQDHRKIVLPYDGSLLFLSTTLADEGMYRCDAYNPELDQEESGCYSNLKFTSRQTGMLYPPILLYRSEEYAPALVGQDAVLTCIYGGKPTPHVFWYRQGDFPSSRHVFGEHNHTLTIKNVQPSDEGQYECSGYSSRQETNKNEFQLRVYAAPQWITSPRSVNATVGSDVEFECRASGILPPEVHWFVNGEPLEDAKVSADYDVSEGRKRLTFYNVTKNDLMNVQCNASNTHGFVHAGASLNVLLPTKIVTPPEDVVLELNSVIVFECKVTSDPGTLLKVTWLRGGEPIVFEENRISVSRDNSLVINTTNEVDGGNSFLTTYTCLADNGNDHLEASAKLVPNVQAIIGDLDPVPVTASSPYSDVITTSSNDVIHSFMVNATMATTESPEVVVAHATVGYIEYDLIWIGLTSGLVAVLILCLLLLLAARRKQAQMAREQDQGILTYLAAGETGDSRVTYQGLSTDDSAFPGFRFVEDTRLQDSLQEVFIPRSRIDLGNLVGKGQFGRVYAAVLRDQRRKVTNRIAVKTLKYKADESEIVELFLREALLMKDFRHAHVLRLIGISIDEDGSPMVVLPFMSNGDLRKFIQDPAKEITVLELLKMGLQVAKGMVYLGNMRFVHRDLAARNCMVDSNKTVKVADFGLSRDLFCRDYYRIGDGKTPLPVRWMAPESLENSVFTTQSDVWSFGVLLWELMTRGAVPYPDVDNWDIGHYIQSGKRLAQPLYCPDSVFEIMQSCWEDQSSDRPSFQVTVKEIECIVNSAKTVGPASSHLYLNISTMTSFSDYRECSV